MITEWPCVKHLCTGFCYNWQNLQETQQQIADEDKAKKEELVKKNPNSIVSVMVLQDMVNT